MKKLLGIFISLQLAIILLFSVQSPAYAQWEKGMHQQDMHGQNMMYRNQGNHNYPQFLSNYKREGNNLFAYASLYKVAVDIILSILFITFFSQFLMKSFTLMSGAPFRNGYFGFTFLVIFPIISIILLGLLWLGIASFLLYGLILLIGVFLTKIFIGWKILQRLEKGYALDWKAGVVGPLVVFILLFIPIFGWITLAVIMSIAVGSLIQELKPFAYRQKLENHKPKITSSK
jgi:hypothetical protein